jgi:hypothetical protein
MSRRRAALHACRHKRSLTTGSIRAARLPLRSPHVDNGSDRVSGRDEMERATAGKAEHRSALKGVVRLAWFGY